MSEQIIGLEQKTYFCYLYIGTLTQACLGFLFITIVIAITWKALYQFVKTHRCRIPNIVMKLLYLMVFLQGIFQLARIICGQVVFFKLNSNKNKDLSSVYSTVTKYIFVFDLFTIFFVETLLLLAPFNYSRNVISIFKRLGKSYRKTIKYQIICVQVFKFYFGIRLVFLLVTVPFLSIDDSNKLNIIVNIIFIFYSIFSAFLSVFLIFGLITIKINKKLKELVFEQDLTKMIRCYYTLICCSVIGLFTIILFTWQNFNQLSTHHQCDLKQPLTQRLSVPFRIINFIMYAPFSHYIPTFIVLVSIDTQQRESTELILPIIDKMQEYNGKPSESSESSPKSYKQ